MKAVFFATAALVGFAAAQSVSDRVNGLEGCQKDCLMNSLTEVGCGDTDVQCACSDGRADNLVGEMAKCAFDITNICVDIDEATELVVDVCGDEVGDSIESKISSAQDAAETHIDNFSSSLRNEISTRLDGLTGTTSMSTPTSPDNAPRKTGAAWVGAAAAIAAFAL